MNNLMLESLATQFDMKHGNDAVQISGWLVFSDGATRERNSYGVMIEPPANPLERAQIQLQYHEERLRRVALDFHEQKESLRLRAEMNLRQRIGMDPPPDRVDLERLTTLQKQVRECQKAVEQAKARVEAATPPKVKSDNEHRDLLRRLNEEALAQIKAIEV